MKSGHLKKASLLLRASVATPVLAWLLFSGPSSAQHQELPWTPTKHIEVVVAASAGGGLDRTARVMQKIFQDLGLSPSSMGILNKPGGGGAIGWTYLSQFSRDGHHISIASPTLITNTILGRSSLTHRDFTALAMLFSEYIVFITERDSELQSGKDLVSHLRKDPASISFAVSPGLGGANHIAVGMFAKSLSIDPKALKIVSFNSAADAMTAVLGKHVTINVAAASNAARQVDTGRIRVLGVCAPERLTGAFASVPTWSEQDADVTVVNWRAAIGPSLMPPQQVRYWNQAIRKLTDSAEWKKELVRNYWGATFMNSEELGPYLDQEQARLKSVLTDIGLAKQ